MNERTQLPNRSIKKTRESDYIRALIYCNGITKHHFNLCMSPQRQFKDKQQKNTGQFAALLVCKNWFSKKPVALLMHQFKWPTLAFDEMSWIPTHNHRNISIILVPDFYFLSVLSICVKCMRVNWRSDFKSRRLIQRKLSERAENKGNRWENMLRGGCGEKQANEVLSWEMIGISD